MIRNGAQRGDCERPADGRRGRHCRPDGRRSGGAVVPTGGADFVAAARPPSRPAPAALVPPGWSR